MLRFVAKNKIKCNKCGDEIESTYTHDFKWCGCKSVAVDGGLSYLKRCGNQSDWTDICEYREATRQEKIEYIKEHIDEYISMFNDADIDLAVESIEEIINEHYNN